MADDVRFVRPRTASLADLLLCGVLSEDDVLAGGIVSEEVRTRAEREWAHLRPSPDRRARTAPSSRRHAAAARPRAPATARPRAPATASHVARVRTRRLLSGDESTRQPQPLALDVCCVCYARARDHVFQPCFHMCVCGTCAARLSTCPMCRSEVCSVHRVYL